MNLTKFCATSIPLAGCKPAMAQEVAGFDGVLDYAKKHYDVVASFGRFPHRNSIPGRTSTPEEAAFLLQPGSRF